MNGVGKVGRNIFSLHHPENQNSISSSRFGVEKRSVFPCRSYIRHEIQRHKMWRGPNSLRLRLSAISHNNEMGWNVPVPSYVRSEYKLLGFNQQGKAIAFMSRLQTSPKHLADPWRK